MVRSPWGIHVGPACGGLQVHSRKRSYPSDPIAVMGALNFNCIPFWERVCRSGVRVFAVFQPTVMQVLGTLSRRSKLNRYFAGGEVNFCLKLNSIQVPNGIAFQFEVSLLVAKVFPWPHCYEGTKGLKPDNTPFSGPVLGLKRKAAGFAWASRNRKACCNPHGYLVFYFVVSNLPTKIPSNVKVFPTVAVFTRRD